MNEPPDIDEWYEDASDLDIELREEELSADDPENWNE
jgi:hypothetical protein